MKTPKKAKSTRKRTASKPARPRSRVVKTVLTKHRALRHLRLVEHKHTGKLLHPKHTSHLVLVIMLAIVGVFLYASQRIVDAQQVSQPTISVGLIVQGPAPTIGAVITSPLDATTVTDNPLTVSGTCAASTLVVVYDNGQSGGATTCIGSVFSLPIQLVNGDNALQALNYDGLNQAGPATPTVTVNIQVTTLTVGGGTETTSSAVAQPQSIAQLVSPLVLPVVPSTAQNACDSYDGAPAKTSGPLKVNVVCMVREFEPLATYKLGLLVEGGTPPYAINVSWGTSQVPDKLVSIANPGYVPVDFAYPIAGEFPVQVNTTDKAGNTAFTQTIGEVNGQPAPAAPTNLISTLQDDVLKTSWFQTPVPLYLVAVTLTLGFWGGDLFYRRLALNRYRRQKRNS